VTDGTFSDRRPQLVENGALEVHKYKKTDDLHVAFRALLTPTRASISNQ
jgi:hypothetical protein